MKHLFDHAVVGERYFFPRPGRPHPELRVAVDGAELSCAHLPLPGAPLTLLHFHGNGEIVADYLPQLAGLFQALGVSLFFAEYRGYGASTGRPAMASMLDDVVAVAQATGVSPERLVVFGRSVGSIYAIELAHRFPNIAGLVLESGIADPLQRVLLRARPAELGVSLRQLQEAARERFDHQAKLSGYRGPLLVLHAQGDHLVDPSHAVRNHRWAGGGDKRLVLFEHGDHNSILPHNQRAYFIELARFIRKLKPVPRGSPSIGG